MRIVHRALRDDLRRLARLAKELDDGPTAIDREQAVAIRDYVMLLGDELARHHEWEARVLWPLVGESASGVIDTRSCLQERAIVAPLLEDLRLVANDFATTPTAGVKALAAVLNVLGDQIDAHVGHQEQEVLTVIAEHVGASDYERAKRQLPRTGWLSRVTWALPWRARFATPEERRHLKRHAGRVTWLLTAVLGRSYATLERRAFAPAD
ncbi:hemerythrin domain-containing protein [Nonomuraea sp. NPDC048916]|uniref:hemerythrin domain-containing protein n=1 Tax=Nonomuraea sp. NPDC048916 TaxID=3154232 RepID=UPI0033F77893